MNLNEAAIELAKSVLAKNGYTVTPPATPAVKYRPAEWPRDWGRADAEFSDDSFIEMRVGTLRAHDPDNSHPWMKKPGCATWWVHCRVPVLPGDEYREPVLPQDRLVACEFSVDGVKWVEGRLYSYACVGDRDDSPLCDGKRYFKYARIRRKSGYEREGK